MELLNEKTSNAQEEAEKLNSMVSGLCNLQHRVKEMVDKMKDMIEMNRSGMESANRIKDFQERLDQLQFLLTQDLYKTGEVARCQHRLINDIECFKDILKCEENKLKKICSDMPIGEIQEKGTPYVSPRESETKKISEVAVPITPLPCPPSDLQSQCDQNECKKPSGRLVNNLASMEDSNAKLSDLFISELNPMGKFIKITNSSLTKAIDIGGYSLCQQTEDGSFFYMFRFPLRTCVPPLTPLKVWSACYDPGLCKSPYDFVASGIMRWAVCPDVITKVLNNCEVAICWIKGAKLSDMNKC